MSLNYLDILYYSACITIWIMLIILAGISRTAKFVMFLKKRPNLMKHVLGISRLSVTTQPDVPKFYFWLALGWSWILIWSWWLMPLLKTFFLSKVETSLDMQIAKLSIWIVYGAYSAAGIYALIRGIRIWFKNIYSKNIIAV